MASFLAVCQRFISGLSVASRRFASGLAVNAYSWGGLLLGWLAYQQ